MKFHTIFIEHSRWDDSSDRYVYIVRAQRLQVADHTPRLAHDDELCEGGHVQKANS